MRLLLVTNIYPSPVEPGKGVFNRRLMQALSRAHEVQVVAPVSWVDEVKRGARGLPLSGPWRSSLAEPVPVHHPRYYYTPGVLRNCYGWFYWHSVRRTVLDLLQTFRPDAVVGYWAHPDGTAAVRVARRAGVPAVVMVGGSDVLLLTRNPDRRRRVLDALLSADAVVPVSADLRARLVEMGVPADRIHVVSRGVDSGLFSPGDQAQARARLGIPSGEKVLLWVGRMVPVKGLDVLLEACARLRHQGPAFHLYLVGTGPLGQELQAASRALGLSGQVHFPGSCPHDTLPDWYRAADWTVLPSRSEGIPNVLRESLACGTPFVASAVGGIPEIARGRDNFLVPPGDPASLADALARALAEPPRPRTLSVPLPTWEDSAESLVQVVRGLIQSPPRGQKSEVRGQRRSAFCLLPSALPWRQWLRRGLGSVLPRSLFLTRGPAGSRAVALTFDDGPHPEHTPRLLDVLRDHGVRATFFVIGQAAERHPELVRRMAAEGHLVGNHTYLPHRGMTAPKPFRELTEEVRRTGTLLTEILGTRARLFRPPSGKLTARGLCWLCQAGYTTVLWNADPRDYACTSAGQVQDWFGRHPLSAGDLVLLHDNHPHAASVVPQLIASAQKQGLRFVPLTEWVPRAAC